MKEIEKILNCSVAVIKDRIKRAKKAMNLRTFSELYEKFLEDGKVEIGDDFFLKELKKQ